MPPLPLTMVKVEAVGAMFRRGKYRSFKNYLSMAADQHIMQGHTMTKGIERMMNKVRRAVERGQCPADQSLPIDLKIVVTLCVGSVGEKSPPNAAERVKPCGMMYGVC